MGLPSNDQRVDSHARVRRYDRASKVALALLTATALAFLLRKPSSSPHRPVGSPALVHPQIPATFPGLAAIQPVYNDDPETIWCYSDEVDAKGLPMNYSHTVTLSLEESSFYNQHQWASGDWTFEAVSVPDLKAPEVRAQLSVSSQKEGCTANICIVRFEDGNRGLATVAPKTGCPVGDPTLVVDIQATVTFAYPETAAKPVHVDRINTDLQSMTQHFKHFRGDVDVKVLFASSTTGEIRVDGMNTDSTIILASTGSVTANISVSDRISTLYTYGGGPIKGSVTLSAPSKEDVGLQVLGLGGAVDLDIALTSPASDGPHYEAYVLGWNKPVRLNVVSLPPGVPLALTTVGIAGNLELILPTTFEGPFTFMAFGTPDDQKPIIVPRSEVPDPTGEGRNRTVSSHSWDVKGGYHVLAGETFWGSKANKSEYLSYVLSESNSARAALLV
ncbi:hypothetical protein EXIGLDRAFT_731464 [Exidia glandulosa HHB12029]|uniref:Adhesin domain-containing protein n=1 Tax=Exidia glandulosa HHB12029 TaxID=1314781 RepID=A0A165L139_EXIGL|nr:hypothetical protein EXIGLDRAFT_731464 [Exidia glandulosa HHB12029]